MERFGLGYDRVRAENPGIVYGQLSSFGVEGPMRDIGANDLSLQAHSGMMSITGDPDRPPVRVGSASIDLHAGLALATAILGALFHRQRSGEGQFVESSLLRSASDLMGYFYTEYWTLGIERGRAGTANHLSVPNQAFPTKDGSVVVISPGDDMWKRCAEALDKDSLGGPEYATMFDRRQRRDKLIAKITAVTQEMTSKELIERLSAAKVNVANVNTISQASADPQLPAIGGVYDFTYRTVQARAVAAPFAMQGTPLDLRRSPPELGAHNREILAEFGFSESEIDRLAQIGAHGPDPEAQ
jgi:crotonobetainyl-CoA:carnitine CoA-transferase CaiB-like acyl-CoA transferase